VKLMVARADEADTIAPVLRTSNVLPS